MAPQEIESRASIMRTSQPALEVSALDAESRAVLDVLTRATMTTDAGTGTMTRPGQNRRLSVLLVMAIFSTAFLGFAFWQNQQKLRAQMQAQASAEPPPPPRPSAAVDPPPPPPAASPSMVAELPATPSPSAKPGKWHKGQPKTTDPAPAPKPKGPDCTPPYTTDAAGNRHYKEECLK
jgi:hypothetical protein